MFDKKDFSKELLEKIKSKKLTPRPKWHFLLKDYMVWGIGAISLIIGAMAFSVIIYMLKYNDWDIYDRISDSFLSFIFLTLPYFWLIFLAVFIFIVYYNLKHTKKGYRYSLPIVLVISVSSSILLGSMFFAIGLGETIDDVLGSKMPLYERIINHRMQFWAHPEEGRLSGLVVSQISENEIIVLNQQMLKWNALLNDVKRPKDFEIIIGRPIRLIGKKINNNVFRAIEILPVGPGRGFLMRDRGMLSPGLPKPPCSDSEDCPNNF
ncbi:MAG: hypothetical protein U9R06_01830 [Patescibacteria group bacterium]|nr:hypothetical protein [Patescibacteria group bacterium]